MSPILFIDIETDSQSRHVLDIGALYGDQIFHENQTAKLVAFASNAKFVCGHNFLQHDYPHLKTVLPHIAPKQIIDTLLLSPLLFPARPYHALGKDYKTAFEESDNNPLTDCIITRDLLESEMQAFAALSGSLKTIFYCLLHDKDGYAAFFAAQNFQAACDDLPALIQQTFADYICRHAKLNTLIRHYAIELAYTLSLIHANHRYSITPKWLLHQYPKIERIHSQLCATPCSAHCSYCARALNPKTALNRYFGYPDFRQYNGQNLQETAALAAVQHQSLLAVFPTGGGKSITFQVPALMAGENSKALTVIISPLQSLMKDQVDNLEQHGITEAVSISGLLDPVQRQKAYQRIEDGSASLLYIAPESLRSRTIEQLLLGRNIARFVIDEAHCFSAWGQDFRTEYQYIGEFIRNLQEKKRLGHAIPVSCFTATAKPQVIADIQAYFQKELALSFQSFIAPGARENLSYRVIAQEDEKQKYQTLRELIQSRNCPTIVYVSRTRRAQELAKQLQQDGFSALPYHGKMPSEEKVAHQNSFISGETQIMVATSAFGMGVDKKDVGLVVHYQISDSLENYIQEAGRAGRDARIQAECFALYHPSDLDKHFIMLNQSRIHKYEIQQIWKTLKQMMGKHKYIVESPLNIARATGWNDEKASEDELETRVKTAIASLEETGYIKRGQNMPCVYASSIVSKNAEEAIAKIQQSALIPPDDKTTAVRIIKKLFSQRSRLRATDEEAESRVDYIGDILGLPTNKVVRVVSWLREENILANQQDLRADIPYNASAKERWKKTEAFLKLEAKLLDLLDATSDWTYKTLNQAVQELGGFQAANPKNIRTLINFWKIKNWVGRDEDNRAYEAVGIAFKHPIGTLRQWLARRAQIAEFVVKYLHELAHRQPEKPSAPNGRQPETSSDKSSVWVEFSIGELKQAFAAASDLFAATAPPDLDELEDTLLYLLKIEQLRIEGGFLVHYQRLHLTRLQMSNQKQYTNDDYKKLALYYQSRMEQIHIVGKYAELMKTDFQAALQLVSDYFSMNYAAFLKRYFGEEERQALSRNMTSQRYDELFNALSPMQRQIIEDKDSRYIAVLAGPGSGKTRVLVHKLASLYQLEEVKHEQLLMLTFSRAAAHEFKSRLFGLIGNAAAYVEIKTFHSYCFDLLGRTGDLDESQTVIRQAIDKINGDEVEPNRIAKSVLVIDEAQDMNADQFELVQTLMAKNEEMRVIAVGDDDQTIYAFQGAKPEYMQQFIAQNNATKYELIDNYRSSQNIVAFCNGFVQRIGERLKTQPIKAQRNEAGVVTFCPFSGCLADALIDKIRRAQTSVGSIAVLTQTNDEAIRLFGQIRQAQIAAKLVQSNDGFLLSNLLEVHLFNHFLNMQEGQSQISQQNWDAAQNKVQEKLARSHALPLLNNIIAAFESANPERKYLSDWRTFLQESRLEDFYGEDNRQVQVSTIHKAKGREYDHVFVIIRQKEIRTPLADNSKKRELYVAFSRAKQCLSILSDSDELQAWCCTADLPVSREPIAPRAEKDDAQIALYLSLKDVYLSWFGQPENQRAVRLLASGDKLGATHGACFDAHGRQVAVFSKSAKQQIAHYLGRGYVVSGAEVNFVVLWQGESMDKPVRVLLPIVYLSRR